MAMLQVGYEHSISTEKLYTSFKWSLNDWSLLYTYYGASEITSPNFETMDEKQFTCSLMLRPRDVNGFAHIFVKFSDDVNFPLIQSTVSLFDLTMTKSIIAENTCKKLVNKMISFSLGRSFAKKDIDTFLTNDTLTLLLELTIVKSITASSISTQRCNENWKTIMYDNLKVIFNRKNYCDVTFVIGDIQLLAHKVILAANSEVFDAMFLTFMKEQKENIIDIVDADAIVFEELLNYMYTGKVTNLESIADELIVVADKYQLLSLKDMCETYLSAHLNNNNVIRYLLIAYKLCCTLLKTKAVNFFKANIRELANEDVYKMLIDCPALIQEVIDKNKLSH